MGVFAIENMVEKAESCDFYLCLSFPTIFQPCQRTKKSGTFHLLSANALNLVESTFWCQTGGETDTYPSFSFCLCLHLTFLLFSKVPSLNHKPASFNLSIKVVHYTLVLKNGQTCLNFHSYLAIYIMVTKSSKSLFSI